MLNLKRFLKKLFIISFVFSLIYLSGINVLSAEEIEWFEIANINNEKQFVDINSIKYDNKGFLSIFTKYSEINPDDQNILDTNSFFMAIDCENRLFSHLPIGGEPNQVKNWIDPSNDKLIKKTIINSCRL